MYKLDVYSAEDGRLIWGETHGLRVSAAGAGGTLAHEPDDRERCWRVEASAVPVCVTVLVDGVDANGARVPDQDPVGTTVVDLARGAGQLHIAREIGLLPVLGGGGGGKTWRYVPMAVVGVRAPGDSTVYTPAHVMRAVEESLARAMPEYTEAPAMQDAAFARLMEAAKERARQSPDAVSAASAQFPPSLALVLNFELRTGEYTHLSESFWVGVAHAVAATQSGPYARECVLGGRAENDAPEVVADRIFRMLKMDTWDPARTAAFASEMCSYISSTLGTYAPDRFREGRAQRASVGDATRAPVSDTNQPYQNTMTGDCENSNELAYLMARGLMAHEGRDTTPLVAALVETLTRHYEPCLAAVTASAPSRGGGRHTNERRNRVMSAAEVASGVDDGAFGRMAHVVCLLLPRDREGGATALIVEGTAWEDPNPFAEPADPRPVHQFETVTGVGRLLRGSAGYGETTSDDAWSFYDTISCVTGLGDTDAARATCHVVMRDDAIVGVSMHQFCSQPHSPHFGYRPLDLFPGVRDMDAMQRSIEQHAIASRWGLETRTLPRADVHHNLYHDLNSPYRTAARYAMRAFLANLLLPGVAATDREHAESLVASTLDRMKSYVGASPGGNDRWAGCIVPAILSVAAEYADLPGMDVVDAVVRADPLPRGDTPAYLPRSQLESAADMCELLTAVCAASVLLRFDSPPRSITTIRRRRAYGPWMQDAARAIIDDVTGADSLLMSARLTAAAPIAGEVVICGVFVVCE